MNRAGKSIKTAYNNIIKEWSEYRNKCKINKCIEEFSELLTPDSYVLDVGCGTGYPVAFFLEKKGFFVTGIDISDKMLESARALKLKNARFIQTDILDFDTTEKFDAVIAFDSLCHISHEEQENIYPKIAE